MEKNQAGKWTVYAFGSPTHATLAGKPITGDAANITANIRIDGGAANAIDDTNPTELEDGYSIFDITATESNGEHLIMCPQSSTAHVIVIGVPGSVWTRPPNFSDLGIETDGDLTQVNQCVANTDMRGTDGANTVVPPTNAQMEARTLLAADYFDPAIDAVANVTNVGTCATNTDMRGTDGANTVIPPTNAQMEARTPSPVELAYIVSNAADGKPVTFSGGTTTTAILVTVDGVAASSTDDKYNTRILVFNAGTLDEEVTDITSYDGATKTATITAVTAAVSGSTTANLK